MKYSYVHTSFSVVLVKVLFLRIETLTFMEYFQKKFFFCKCLIFQLRISKRYTLIHYLVHFQILHHTFYLHSTFCFNYIIKAFYLWKVTNITWTEAISISYACNSILCIDLKFILIFNQRTDEPHTKNSLKWEK